MAKDSAKSQRRARPTADTGTPKAPSGLRVLMIASEAQPFSKTGGLADVAAALPKALARLGHDVTLVTPRYRGVTDGPVAARLSLEVAGHRFQPRLMEGSASAREYASELRRDRAVAASGREGGPVPPRILLLDCPELYDRAGLYYDATGDYADNAVRYALLSAAAMDWAADQSEAFDIIHAHDWQGGLAPIYARRLGTRHPAPGTVFTIHNLAYQGLFDKGWVPRLGLAWDDFTLEGFEFFDRLSFMKAGLNFGHAIATVSPTYAEEIQRPEYGYGLDGVIRNRRDALVGILNGIDHDEWNPAADPHLPAPFDADHLDGKAAAKRALLEVFGFTISEALLARPLIGMVSRMVDQKGLDLIAAAAGELSSLDATFVIVGTGEPRYQDMWQRLSQWRPDRIQVFIGFDERRAHLVEGGADIFLMPSRFEPCGLNQMYSLRYGTVPLVRAVGGLVDTVRPFDPQHGGGTGFMFAGYTPAAMMHALTAALAAFPNKQIWRRLQQNGMKEDFSWARSAAEYVKMYNRLRPQRVRQAPGPQKARKTPGPQKAQKPKAARSNAAPRSASKG